MKLTVCIGSSCHVKGSRQVVNLLQELIKEYALEDQVTLNGTFCEGNCQKGVSVLWQGECFSLNENNTNDFFSTEILPVCKGE